MYLVSKSQKNIKLEIAKVEFKIRGNPVQSRKGRDNKAKLILLIRLISGLAIGKNQTSKTVLRGVVLTYTEEDVGSWDWVHALCMERQMIRI